MNETDQSLKSDKRASLLTDLYVDFLGSLVPGLFTIILATAILAWSGNALCNSICFLKSPSPTSSFPVQPFSGSPEALSLVDSLARHAMSPYATTVILLVVAYVLGSIFYRQDPKVPDLKSARRIYKAASDQERMRSAVQPTSNEADKGTLLPRDVQFPYFFLHEYLAGRGLKHLAKLVPWKGKDNNTHRFRTKMFINLIKIRLQFLIPEKCKDIVRNEAHVRLATSLWYASRWLIVTGGIATIMAFSSLVIAYFSTFQSFYVAALFLDIVVLVLAWLIKHKIENFIHYLRVREIVYVLETAHFTQKNGMNLHLDDLYEKTLECSMPKY